MSTQTTTEPRTIEQLLRRLPANVYDNLTAITGLSQHRLTKIKARPECARYEEALELAAILKESPVELITDYRMGYDNITIGQMDTLGQDFQGTITLGAI